MSPFPPLMKEKKSCLLTGALYVFSCMTFRALSVFTRLTNKLIWFAFVVQMRSQRVEIMFVIGYRIIRILVAHNVVIIHLNNKNQKVI